MQDLTVENRLHLVVAGGDLRQIYAAETLAKSFAVTLLGFDSGIPDLPCGVDAKQIAELKDEADALILPMPAADEDEVLPAPYSRTPLALSDVLPRVRQGGCVLGGRITERVRRRIGAVGLRVTDYAEDEAFAVRNAVPTAEGAIQIAMQELPVTLHGLPCLILGAGRLSRALVPRLCGLGAQVTVAARRFSDLAWAQCREGKPHHKTKIPA